MRNRTRSHRSILRILLLFCLVWIAAGEERTPKTAYRARRVALAEKTHGGAILLLGEGEPEDDRLSFRQNSDFYYLTGWSEPDAVLLIVAPRPSTGLQPAQPYTETLFIPERNLWREHLSGPMLVPNDSAAPGRTGVDRVESLGRLNDVTTQLVLRPAVATYVLHPALFEGEHSGVNSRRLFHPNLGLRGRLTDVEPLLKSMRTVKDRYELIAIKNAIDASIAAHLQAMKSVRGGKYEYQIAAIMQSVFQSQGCERSAYPPIVASGINSAYAHHYLNSDQMKVGDLVVIDVGAECSMYAADITRTLPVGGTFSARQRELYDIVLGAQQEVVRAFQVGKSKLLGPGDSLHEIARAYINSHGIDKHGQPLGKYFQGGLGGLGHNVGLDAHDSADYSLPLSRGAVFTLEPGVYIPEEGLGIRIEDMYWVNPEGQLVKLTSALPSSIEDLERTMKTGK
jgi:Xaa-Pro aminopeptidase